MVTARDILLTFYPDDTPLRRLLLVHSRLVALHALSVARRHPELRLDRRLLYEGAMVHDVGIFLCSAPRIHCHGTSPYLAHGPLGAALVRRMGREDLARICERHTGTGLTADLLRRRGVELALPDDLRPETPEEQVVCYADKFYSKSRPALCRTYEATLRSLEGFGDGSPDIFAAWHRRFG